jgi:hypothetical protein
VISPIHLGAVAYTGPNGIVRVELIGEDGQLIYRQILRGNSNDVTYFNMSINIDFQIAGVSEAARLQVSVDDGYKRPVVETSVDLVLLSMGDAQINPPDDGLSSIVIRQPTYLQVITGSTLHIEGVVRPLNDSPLLAELLSETGGLIGSRQISTPNLPLGTYRPFSIDIPFTIDQAHSIRLVISQQGNHIPGVALLNSVLIWLKP